MRISFPGFLPCFLDENKKPGDTLTKGRPMKPRLLLVSPLVATLLSGCLTGGDSGSNPPGFKNEVGPYRVEGAKIITLAGQVKARNYCSYTAGNKDTLIQKMDTSRADTSSYELDGGTLRLFFSKPDTLYSDSNAAVSAVISIYSSFERSGSGSGLDGQWIFHGSGYRVLSGALTPEQMKNQDKSIARSNFTAQHGILTVTLSGSVITTYQDMRTAELFVASWNGIFQDSAKYADSSRYDISVRAVDKLTVEMKGRKTGETVYYTEENDRSRTYKSDSAAHIEYHYSPNPTSCPNSSSPQWFRDFKTANTKPGSNGTLGKRGSGQEQEGAAEDWPFLP